MKKIYKYILGDHVQHEVNIPEHGIVLTVALQNNLLCIWVLVNPISPTTIRKFKVYGTGWPIEVNNLKYINTVFDKNLVWHIFENLEN